LNYKKHIILISGIFITTLYTFTSSCKKTPVISAIPAITFDSIRPNPCIAYQDTVKIVISYIDGDGDLGQDSASAKNMFVTDSRNNVVSQFRIPQLTSSTGSAIQGNLNITLPPQYFINNADTTETVTYSIYVIDRAGHQSNTVKTTPLVINM